MKAAVCSKYGSPDGIKIIDVEKPVPKDNEVLVKIHATTVTFGDAMLRSFKFPLKQLFGHEFAGIIESVGKEVARFAPGDQVFGSTGFDGGAHSEYKCLAEEGMIAIKPANMSFDEAAAVPVGGNTALYLLRKSKIKSVRV